MKKMLLNMVAVLLVGGVWAQLPVIKLYACSQETIPGIKPVSPEDGKEINNPLPVAYYLYAEVKKGTRPKITAVYIKGVLHSATLEKVAAPVLVVMDAVTIPYKKKVLVKKTRNDVYRVIPGEPATMNEDVRGQQLAVENEVVLVMNQRAGKQYATTRKIQQLPQLAGM
jgi:hypothetical protein